MTELTITQAEKEHGHLEDTRLAMAVRAVREEGFVVLHNAIDPAHIAVLRERMLADAAQIAALDQVPYQFRTGHLQQDPPPFSPYLFRDVLVNAFAVDITQALLGEGVKNAFYSGNCCLPNNNRQPLHVDIGHLWPGLQKAHPAHALVVNVPVVDMTAENGSTELWPGTHLDTTRTMGDGDIKIPDTAARARARTGAAAPAARAGRQPVNTRYAPVALRYAQPHKNSAAHDRYDSLAALGIERMGRFALSKGRSSLSRPTTTNGSGVRGRTNRLYRTQRFA